MQLSVPVKVMFNISCPSCILVPIFRTPGKRHFSTRIYRFFTTVPPPLYFLTFYHSMHFTRFYILRFNNFFFQFLSMGLPCIHFSIHVLILFSNFFIVSLFKIVNELIFIWCWTFSKYCSLLNKNTLNLYLELWFYYYLKNAVLAKIFVPQLKGYCEFFDIYQV